MESTTGSIGLFDEDFIDAEILRESSDTTDSKDSESILAEPIHTNSAETIISMSPDDLVDINLGFDDEDDLQDLQELRDMLKSKGYSKFENLDYESLLQIKQREDSIVNKDKEIEQLVEGIQDLYDNTCSSLSSTKPTLLQKNADYTDLDKLRANVFSTHSACSKDVQVACVNIIHEMVSAKREVTVDNVYQALCMATTFDRTKLEFEQENVIRFLEMAIPIVLNSYENSRRRFKKNYLQRMQTASFLLAKEKGFVDDIANTSIERISIIKQIFKRNDTYYCNCDKCNRLVELNHSPCSIIAFQEEKGSTRHIFPHAYDCDCGQKFVFTQKDYISFLKSYLKSATKDVTNLLQVSNNFCRGTSVIRIEPAFEDIFTQLEFLISDSSESSDNGVKNSDDSNKAFGELTVVNDSEFMAAVEHFYHRLKGFNENCESMKITNSLTADNTDDMNMFLTHELGLSIREVAYYLCQCLSLNYSEVKNRAIFSIIYNIKENPVLNELLSTDKIASLKTHIALISNSAISASLIPEEQFVELKSLYGYLTKKGYITSIFNANDASREDIIASLRNALPYLQEELQALIDAHNVAVDDFIHCRSSLIYCKIINTTSIHLSEFDDIMGDAKLFNFINSISDDIIVNNFADSFFPVWERLGYVDRASLERTLLTNAGVNKTKSSITKVFEKIVGKDIANSLSELKTNFSLSPTKHACLHSLTFMMKRCNYYRFCEAFKQISYVDRFFNDDFYENRLKFFLENFQSEALQVTSEKEYEFYLKDFSKDELEPYSNQLELLSFGRYIPKRLDNETVPDYIERYSNVASNNFDDCDCYDFLEKFEILGGCTCVAATCSMFYDMEYKNYTIASFMTLLIKVVTQYLPEDRAANLLGITQNHLNIIKADIPVCSNYSSLEELIDRKVIKNSFYTTSIQPGIESIAEQYDSVLLSASYYYKDNLLSLFDDRLIELLSKDYFAKEEDGEPINDKEYALAELLALVNSNKYNELIRRF